ncbi:hypothetical protein EST38_g13891 [Candolleomyces aberdarensis]|uniref:Nephrocystin 3-like N-terminal domain-containing protein n=1 Tax=Candolleomyces aberdarensis TaxID=2316362 RepID=A0A4Q2D1G6_9AGAR|nr:hypothetical protein EST38_g13891 [Candolleomyces aberdarensis]
MASTLPATVPLIKAALEADAGLLNNSVSWTRQLERLVYRPFQAVTEGDILEMALTKGPFIIVIDGLDECDDKPGMGEFIDHMLLFFEENPTIPLRIFIASRVEQHIRERLDGDGVLLCNLDSHLPEKDIEKFLESSFDSRAKRDRVIRAYVNAHGKWPTMLDMGNLLKHVGSSFILASTVFKFIVQSPTREDPLTPMARLPLTLKMNGLDGLYQKTLARSQHVPYFHDIISTITLLRRPLPIVGTAHILGIEAFQVVHVLLNLQAIVHVPGSDEQGDVTVCHKSLQDFLVTPNRSGHFFVQPSFHLRLAYYYFCTMLTNPSGYNPTPFFYHWQSFVTQIEPHSFIKQIDLFEANPPLYTWCPPTPGSFFLYAFSHSVFLEPLSSPDLCLYMLTSWSKELALGIEYPDRIKPWLESSRILPWQLGANKGFKFTKHTYEALHQDLQRASTHIHSNVLSFVQFFRDMELIAQHSYSSLNTELDPPRLAKKRCMLW